jgi:predicted nucleotidyltransferase
VRASPPHLLPIFRSQAQGRLLALLFDDPARQWSLTELATAADTSQMTAHREIERAEDAGLVVSHREGRNRKVQASDAHPLFEPLRQVILATFGAPHEVAKHLRDIPNVTKVMIYGSWAARYKGEPGAAPRDLDVLVIGDEVDRDAVDAAADRIERAIGMPVQATVRTTSQWHRGTGSFIEAVQARPYVTVIDAAAGSDDVPGPLR